MLVPLEHGKPVRFGPDGEKGVIIAENGSAVIVDVAEVGEERILVHDESRPDPSWLLPFPASPPGPIHRRPSGC